MAKARSIFSSAHRLFVQQRRSRPGFPKVGRGHARSFEFCRCCYRALFFQNALLAGLDGFYRSYVASESDTSNREEQDATIISSLYSCIRLEHRGAVHIPHCAAFRYFLSDSRAREMFVCLMYLIRSCASSPAQARSREGSSYRHVHQPPYAQCKHCQ